MLPVDGESSREEYYGPRHRSQRLLQRSQQRCSIDGDGSAVNQCDSSHDVSSLAA